jgi:hypothetical protein
MLPTQKIPPPLVLAREPSLFVSETLATFNWDLISVALTSKMLRKYALHHLIELLVDIIFNLYTICEK